jgi:4-amino-4-deoxy-L-arabinose transferase-like glycosyltransferase
MVATGDYLFPHRAGELYPDKPPVFMWIQAAILKATGSIRLAAQLPSLLAGLGTLGLVVALGRRLWGDGGGLAAAAVLLAIVQFPLQARVGQIDATVTFFITLGLYALLRHLLWGPAWGWYSLSFAAMAVGIATKGVGFLPLLVILPWAYAAQRRWPALPRIGRSWKWTLGPLALIAVLAAWLVPMVASAGSNPELVAYRNNILFSQTAERYADSWGHIEPWWYYLVEVIPALWLPASLALPLLVKPWRERLRERDPRFLLLLGWIVLVILFFSLSPGKRGVYLLPATPALALACAPWVPQLWRHPRLNQAAFALMALIAAAITTVAVLGCLGRGPLFEPKLANLTDTLLPTAAIAAVVLAGPLLGGPRRGLLALLIALGSGWLMLGLWISPRLNGDRSGRNLMTELAAQTPPTAELALVGWKEQFLLHLDRPTYHFGFGTTPNHIEDQLDDAATWLDASGGRVLLLPDIPATRGCFDLSHGADLGIAHRQRWHVVARDAIRPACRDLTIDPRVFSSVHHTDPR